MRVAFILFLASAVLCYADENAAGRSAICRRRDLFVTVRAGRALLGTCTDNLTGISKSTFARIRERSDSNCRLASGWLLCGVFVFGRILGAATATANFFFFAGFKVADEHVELDNALLFRIFVGFPLWCHNCASCESDDDDRVLVCLSKTALVRVDCGDGRLVSRVSETSLDSH